MAISKITLNGVTQMDVTQKTVTAASMLDGATALKNDGTDIMGNIASKTSSDLTVSGATVTAPAGYYGSAASKTIPDVEPFVNFSNAEFYTSNNTRKWHMQASAEVDSAEGDTPGYFANGRIIAGEWIERNAIAKNTSVTPTESAQTIGGADTMMEGAVTVNAIPSSYVGSGITQRSSSDLAVSGVTVTAPAGYYSSDATIDLAIDNKLPDFASYSTTTLRGVTFTWTNGQCAITGSNTGTNPSYNALYNSTTALPSALVAGNSYYLGLKWNRTPTAFIRLYCYNSQGSAVTNLILRDSSVITIPSNAVGLTLRVEVGVNVSGADGDILKDIILLSIT